MDRPRTGYRQTTKHQGTRADLDAGPGKALHHQKNAHRRQDIVPDLDDLAFLAVVISPLFEKFGEVAEEIMEAAAEEIAGPEGDREPD